MVTSAKQRRHSEIRRMRESYTREGRVAEFYDNMEQIFADPATSLQDWSIRKLFEALVDDGYEYCQLIGERSGGYRLQEADNVNTGMFANIIGQFLYNATLRAYNKPGLIGDSLVTRVQSVEVSERLPGVTALGDDIEVTKEGDPYARATMAERWVETPDTIKRGLIIDITKEVLFFDKTNLILNEAAKIGELVAINRERRILDVVTGIATVYRRNGGAAQATYASDNTVASNGLVDFTSLDAADTKFHGLVDPDTGEPIVTVATDLLVPPALKNTAMRILNATMTNTNSNNTAGTQDVETRVAGNSLNQSVQPYYNQYVKERTSSDTTWFYGNFREAFVYMENWPLQVEQEGANGPQAFDRDIIQRYKASERGAAGVRERLHTLKCTA